MLFTIFSFFFPFIDKNFADRILNWEEALFFKEIDKNESVYCLFIYQKQVVNSKKSSFHS